MINDLPGVPFYLMVKPTGAVCNLNCDYCYYLEKERLYPRDPQRWSMSDKMLELFTAQYIYSTSTPEVLFTWHGGEPLLRGREFFENAIRLQHKHAAGRVIRNSLQTNGTMITEDWCRFFREHDFLIGISVDGPEHCHDHYRKYHDGRASFGNTMRGIELLKKFSVEFNTLSVVNDYNARFPLDVYRFLKSIGSRYMQFTPVVERVHPSSSPGDLYFLPPGSGTEEKVTPWSVDPLDYGNFLIRIFDEWVRNDVGNYFVITFDSLLANLLKVPPALCVHAKTCGNAGVVEFNGDVYSCDHYVFPDYRLGNIRDKSLLTFMTSPQQQRFGRDKYERLPQYCLRCEFLGLCYGECPKNRIICTPGGEPGLNYLCSGFRLFYRHIMPYLEFMAAELTQDRPASNVRQWRPGKK